MSDYKDIFSSIVDKAKEFAASDAVSGLVEKVKTVAEESGVARVYEDGAARTKAYAKIAKLTVELNGSSEELKRVYAEIGKLYYEQAKDAPEGYFAPLFAQAAELNVAIDSKQAEVQVLKDEFGLNHPENGEEVEIADFEQIVNETESDGVGEEK